MSGAEPPVGASSGSPPPPPPPQQQQQEITAAQLSDALREIIRLQQRQQQQAARSRSDELRGWLMVVATLTASITYSAALNPPGGVWQADDPAKGYIAGRPVVSDKFRRQYLAFYYSNVMSFVTSLGIIVLSSTPSFYNTSQTNVLSNLVALDILALAGAFFAGSWTTPGFLVYDALMILIVVGYIVGFKFMGRLRTTGHIDQSV